VRRKALYGHGSGAVVAVTRTGAILAIQASPYGTTRIIRALEWRDDDMRVPRQRPRWWKRDVTEVTAVPRQTSLDNVRGACIVVDIPASMTKGNEMDHDETAARRSECFCETCTDRAAWGAQDA
jgi:hypothetical protein